MDNPQDDNAFGPMRALLDSIGNNIGKTGRQHLISSRYATSPADSHFSQGTATGLDPVNNAQCRSRIAGGNVCNDTFKIIERIGRPDDLPHFLPFAAF
jgi:hypothetical protein